MGVRFARRAEGLVCTVPVGRSMDVDGGVGPAARGGCYPLLPSGGAPSHNRGFTSTHRSWITVLMCFIYSRKDKVSLEAFGVAAGLVFRGSACKQHEAGPAEQQQIATTHHSADEPFASSPGIMALSADTGHRIPEEESGPSVLTPIPCGWLPLRA